MRFNFFPCGGVCSLFFMRFSKRLLLISATAIALGAPQDVSYIRYFRTADDLLRGVQMKPAEARNVPHVEALYNSFDQLVSKITVGEDDVVSEQETYEYREDGSLWKRAIVDGDGNVRRMVVHGDEEMSATFISLVFPHRNRADFNDRTTIYDYTSDGKVWRYKFLSLDHTPFGQIEFDFFEEGLVKEERWTDLLAGQTVRLFKYRYNPISREYTMLEYDASGEEVSRVGLVLPRRTFAAGTPVDDSSQLGGNRLEESSEIIEDILMKKAEGWNPSETVGKLMDPDVLNSPDLIYMKSGDTLRVDLLKITDQVVRFLIRGDRDVLTMPLVRVGEIERRDGHILYPVIYR